MSWVEVMREKVQSGLVWFWVVAYFTGPISEQSFNEAMDLGVTELAQVLFGEDA